MSTEKRERPADIEVTAKVVEVFGDKYDENGLCVALDTKLAKVTPKGEKTESEILSKKIRTLAEQVKEAGCKGLKRFIRKAKVECKTINPEVLMIVLEGATIKLKGTYHFKDEKRNFEGATEKDVYTSDIWVFDIIEWSNDTLDNEDAKDLQDLLERNPFKTSNTTASNVADWYK